ncbi:hypothetical protein BDZ45DRAFT_614759 [Acephala macrosclerotiorum]|nr:hypothetical protein BDZ45DRAFT_614759 [Acephala macrosclerotiorum]
MSGSFVCDRAHGILSRLPSTPPSLEKLYPEFFESEKWNDLAVVSKLDTNTIRLALALSCDRFWGPERPRIRHSNTEGVAFHPLDDWDSGGIQYYVDSIAEMLEQVTFRLAECINEEDRKAAQAWFTVHCFLWASLQRSIMLLFWHVLDNQLKWGYVVDEHSNLIMRVPIIAPKLSLHETIEHLDEPTKSPYMCNWAYHLLRTERCSVTMDFRRFHQRFNDLWAEQPARCLRGNQGCNGRSPKSCQRFAGAKSNGVNQSAHNQGCEGQCQKLYWDEISYRSVGGGGRAVCIDSTDNFLLKYVRASDHTLAISHVWNHGQGGRPEAVLVEGEMGGFNNCLHERYAAIANRLGCDSYWMDTPCIPEDHELRAESISNINKVFTESKITLVCDRDIMQIDVRPLLAHPDGTTGFLVGLRESIIATLLVCDWNVRSWTLLESMRGRKNIHLLCKDNEVIHLKKVVDMTCQHGSIDIAILFMSCQHMLPAIAAIPEQMNFPARIILDDINLGYIRIEEAACLLNSRHASRPGDDLVIWSLLVGPIAFNDPERLWHAQLSTVLYMVRTGFLLSSAPRMKGIKGLQWAPRQPAFHLPANATLDAKIYPAYDGSDTEFATIRKEGLGGEWAVHEFSRKSDSISASMKRRMSQELGSPSYRWGVLLQPLNFSTKRYVAAHYRGGNRHLLGVAGSDDQQSWEWIGIFEWLTDEPLPGFSKKYILLV